MNITDSARQAGRALAEDRDPMPAERDVLLEAVLKLSDLADSLRQTQTDGIWATIPTFVQEHAYTPALAPNTPLAVTPLFSTLVKIEHVTVCVPTGAVGTVQLGGDVFPCIPAGVTSLALNKLLGASDTRTLTIMGATGPAALSLHGTQMAPEGSLSL